jgi:hypothetical protein
MATQQIIRAVRVVKDCLDFGAVAALWFDKVRP